MLRKLLKRLKQLVSRKARNKQQGAVPGPKIGDVVGNVTITTQSQVVKHTEYKVGESYKLGESIVTLHANKEAMLASIAAVAAKREEKNKRLTKRGEDLMLMSPDELMELKLDEWLAGQVIKHSILQGIVGVFTGKRYSRPEEVPPSGSKKERFKNVMKNVKIKEKV